MWRPPFRLLLNASRTFGIGRGFVVDLRNLSSRPIRRAAVWEGDLLVEIESSAWGKYRLVRGSRRVPVAPGWYVLGVSEDLRLALACRKAPFDGDKTYLLRLQRRTGHASVIAAYPNASDDHHWLNAVARNGPRGRVLVHSQFLPWEGNATTPFLAESKLRPIVLKSAAMAVDSSVEWVDSTTPWALVGRRLMVDGSNGFDARTLDLWNPDSGATVRLAKATDYWTEKEGSRGHGPTIGAYAVDWPSRQIAYVMGPPGSSRIVVQRFRIPR